MRMLFQMDRKNYKENGSIVIRPSVRGMIFQGEKIGLLHSKTFHYYIFPGGGIEKGESNEEALIREIKEETGLTVIPATIQEYGMVHCVQKGIDADIFIQDNLYYFFEAEANVEQTNLEPYEKDEGYELAFVTVEQAIDENRNADHGEHCQDGFYSSLIERETRVLELIQLGGRNLDRQYTKIDTIRHELDNLISNLDSERQRRNAYIHCYGVGQAAGLIALHRGFSRKEAELAEIAGMLHDYVKFFVGIKENHAHLAEPYVRKLLVNTGEFSQEDIDIICLAVYKHADKDVLDTPFDEIVKDADEMQHFLRNPMEDYALNKPRVQKLGKEYGFNLV